jgi:hypothetical protein
MTAKDSKERFSMRILFDTGSEIAFTCADFTSYSSPTGELTGYEVEDATGAVPRWVDLKHVVAIIREVKA